MKNSFFTRTELLGIIGSPVKQSFSPFIHNVAAELTGTQIIYLPFDVHSSNLKSAINGMVALGIKGFNVTLPHKIKVVDYLSKVSEEAAIVGAVNTIVNDLGKLTGYNTDVYGILETLNPFKAEISDSNVTVLGAGGGSRAVLYSLIRYFKPNQINLLNRTEQHSEYLKQYFKDKMKYKLISTIELFSPEMTEALRNSKLIINTTSVGMYPDVDDSIINNDHKFRNDQIVFDLVYNPIKTKLIQLAETNGATALNGLTMLIHQAAKSFSLWTNKEFPVEKVYKSVLLYLGK
jgi:shikimate dehydrogenase